MSANRMYRLWEGNSMSNRELGICLIGCGRAGMIHARNFRNKVPGARMEAVADVQESAAIAAAQELGITSGAPITAPSWMIPRWTR